MMKMLVSPGTASAPVWMLATISVADLTLASSARIPELAKVTFAPAVKFSPEIFSSSWSPRAAWEGVTALIMGAAALAGLTATGRDGGGAAIEKFAFSAVLSGLLT